MKKVIIMIAGALLLTCTSNGSMNDHLKLKDKLSGKWKAEAFSGELREEWILGNDGWMQQQGYYIEEGDTTYSAVTRIEKVGVDLILFSVIKGSDPKIFKSMQVSDNEMTFENKDYKNPYQVKYEFINPDQYRRTIMGYEGDSLVQYVFNFEKLSK